MAMVNVAPSSLASQAPAGRAGVCWVVQRYKSVGAGLPAIAMVNVAPPSLASQAPTGRAGVYWVVQRYKPLGAGLPAIAMVNVTPSSLASQAPTGRAGVCWVVQHHKSVGAGLPAIAMVNVAPPSLASQAPTGARGCLLGCATPQICGSWPASDGDGECDTVIAGKPGSYRVMRMRRRALRVRRMESISAAQLRPTIRPCHSPLGPLGSPNQSVRPSA